MKQKLLSVLLLSYYSGERLRNCYNQLTEVLDAAGIPFELIVMDDGSKDDSYKIALAMEANYPNVRAYQLSKNYTTHYSIFACLSVCAGACAVPIPDDEQQPYETLVAMYRLWERGEKVVIPHRIQRDDSFVSRTFSQSFYKLMNALSEVKYPEGGADTFFIDRELIDILNTRIHPMNTSVVSEVLRLGFSPYFLPYARPLGNNKKSRWSFKKKWKLAKDFFYSSSSFPIKMITNAGLFFSAFALILVMFFVIIKILDIKERFFIFNANVQGWTSLIIAITFFSGMIMLSIGVISEYIFRIYEEVKARPGYIIRQKESPDASDTRSLSSGIADGVN